MIWQQEDCHLQWMFHNLIKCVNSLYTCDQISDFIISVRVTWQMVHEGSLQVATEKELRTPWRQVLASEVILTKAPPGVWRCREIGRHRNQGGLPHVLSPAPWEGVFQTTPRLACCGWDHDRPAMLPGVDPEPHLATCPRPQAPAPYMSPGGGLWTW